VATNCIRSDGSKPIGLGVLGLSGKYENITSQAVEVILRNIDFRKFSYIDTASVYDENAVPINTILGSALKGSPIPIKVCYKIGGGGDALTESTMLKECEVALAQYGSSLATIMIHRASEQHVKSHAKFIERLKIEFPALSVGLSAFDSAVLGRYLDEVDFDVVQLPLNLLDFSRNIPMFACAKKKGLLTQARSSLSSGLLSGKYCVKDLQRFTDSIRKRYRETPAAQRVFEARMEKVQKIQEFALENQWRYNHHQSLSWFSYAAVLSHDYVDSVIIGGSAASHFAENQSVAPLPPDILVEIYGRALDTWQAPTLG
jgi:aryl-alcohol dehydrogenase-like predicted oxidoreductase